MLFLSARTPPKVVGQPGLKSNRSLIAAGTPCSGGSSAPLITAASAFFASARAPSKSVKISALRLGLRVSIRAMVASISSTGDTCLERMRSASSAALT